MLPIIQKTRNCLNHVKNENDIYECIKRHESLLKSPKLINHKDAAKFKAMLHEDFHRMYITLAQKKPLDSAMPLMLKALEYKEDPVTYNNLAYIYLSNYNDYKKGIDLYERCIKLKPDFNVAYHGLIQIYKQIKNVEKEKEYIDMGLCNCPKDGEFYNFKGVYLFESGLVSDAIKTFNDGLKATKDPKIIAKILMNLGHVHSTIGDPYESLVFYLKSLDVDPEHVLSYENILLNVNYFNQVPKNLCNYNYLSPGTKKTMKFIETVAKTAKYHSPIDEYHSFVSSLLYPSKSSQKSSVATSAPKKTKYKIGYVSGDLIDHAVSIFSDSIFNDYNADKFEVYTYSTKYYEESIVRNIGRDLKYRHIQNHSLDKIVDMIRNDGIDVLIDLSGYTSGNKLDLFGRLQDDSKIKLVSYLGYPRNTGIRNVYRVTDEYTEKFNESDLLIKLPRLFLCFKPKFAGDMNIMKKFIQGFEDHIVIGSFAKLQKINEDVIRVWLATLDYFKERNVKCILLVKSKYFTDPKVKTEWTAKFKGRSDVLLVNGTGMYKEHVELFNLLDVQLDTWPYSGTTITCESLFMNVPVVTMNTESSKDVSQDHVSRDHVSRVSGSILNAMVYDAKQNPEFSQYEETLKSLICNNDEDYIKRVFEIAQMKRQIPIHHIFMKCMDPKRFVGEYEQGLLKFIEK
jgi:hypothetical protein